MAEKITTGLFNLGELLKRFNKKQPEQSAGAADENPAAKKTIAEQIIAAHCGCPVRAGEEARVKLDGVLTGPAAVDDCLADFIRPGALIAVPVGQQYYYGAYNMLAVGLEERELTQAAETGEITIKVPETIRFKCFAELPEGVTGRDFLLFLQGQLIAENAGGRILEFIGETIHELSMESRLLLAGQSAQLGGDYAVMAGDVKLLSWLAERRMTDNNGENAEAEESDENVLVEAGAEADHFQLRICDVTRLEPQLACPESMECVMGVNQLLGNSVDWALLGGSGSGWLEELRQAADVLRGESLAAGVQMYVVPASERIYQQAQKEGLLDIFRTSGAMIAEPSAIKGADLLGSGLAEKLPEDYETVITTAQTNSPQIIGGAQAGIYLASAASVAAAAINGFIEDPRIYNKKIAEAASK